jgi:serine/threonine protein kinase
MRYVHSRHIIHLDLKPSNILVNSSGYPWIADFGSSRLVSDRGWSEEMPTVYYAAPEMYRQNEQHTLKCDVFSFGLILYEMLVGKPVFPRSEHLFTVMRRLRDEDFPAIPAESGRVMGDLIGKCWQKEPKDRPSFHEIFTMFESCNFDILPGADPVQLGNFCAVVVRWEEQAGIRYSDN